MYVETISKDEKHWALGTKKCPYCGSDATHSFFAQDTNRKITNESFSYSNCICCGLVFIDEIPHEISPYYAGGYQPIPTSLAELHLLAAKEKYRLEPILRHKKNGKLLELGPWIGIFSSNAKDAGFEVTAIDMNVDCVQFLQNELKIKAVLSDNPAAAVADLDESFDVVVLWHCIEHFPEPWEVIKQAARALKPGGVLLVALPNIESYEFSVLKSRWTHVDAPRHLYFYPIKSLTALCKNNGLRCIEATTSDELSAALRRSSWHSWGQNKILRPHFLGRVLGAILGRLAPLFVGSAGRAEGAGAGITAVYIKDAPGR